MGLFGNDKVFCVQCQRRIYLPPAFGNGPFKKEYVEYSDGYYCLACSALKTQKMSDKKDG